MKLAVVGESVADEAAVRTLVEAVYASHPEKVVEYFPIGFGSLVRAIRSWREE